MIAGTRIDRRTMLGCSAALLTSAAMPAAAAIPTTDRIRVPLDHFSPSLGTAEIGYEWAGPYDPARPTVLLVADAQQFYVRPGAARDLQSKLFGAGVNVLALFGRASSSQVRNHVRVNGMVDWSRAARLLNVHQWMADLASAADQLELPPTKLALYGRSGGADLTLRFLSAFPQRARRAYVQAAVCHDLAAKWGLDPDRIWADLAARDPATASGLAELLVANPNQRREAILLLQRQNFYESANSLSDARLKLAKTLIRSDSIALADYRSKYQLDSLEKMQKSGESFSPVRLHEFSRSYTDPRGAPPPFRPDIEAMFYYAEPVTRTLYDAAVGKPVPTLDGLRQSNAEVLILAGRYDHTCDYRTQMGLSGMIPSTELMILQDDHVFARLQKSGLQPALLSAFFQHGLGSPQFRTARAAASKLVWTEL